MLSLSSFFFEGYGYHRDLHLLTHSFPTRRSSYLTRVRSMAGSSMISASRARLRSASTKITDWSMRSTVVAAGVTSTRTGSRRKPEASWPIEAGMVDEKNRPWRCLGQAAENLRNAWEKPKADSQDRKDVGEEKK